MGEKKKTYLAAKRIIPLLEAEPSLSPLTRVALVELVSAFEQDRYENQENWDNEYRNHKR